MFWVLMPGLAADGGVGTGGEMTGTCVKISGGKKFAKQTHHIIQHGGQ